ncbi:hypothetical protein PG994_009701 [Apiospora phragmitis]|uniref:Uncharacterized protein n=1 Tax=Apiospora phragmitis TaxID=2905665 RepID=A0ABR1U9L0_9PEZI
MVTLATAAIFGSAQAYQGWLGSNTLVDGEAVRFSQPTWRQHLGRPDAKGEYPVRGFDISQKWPDVHEVSGWKLAVNVSNSIPVSEVQNAVQALSNSSSFTGTSISLKGPESIIHSILGDNNNKEEEIINMELRSTTWKVCVTIATDDNKNVSSSSSGSGNGNCDRLSAQLCWPPAADAGELWWGAGRSVSADDTGAHQGAGMCEGQGIFVALTIHHPLPDCVEAAYIPYPLAWLDGSPSYHIVQSHGFTKITEYPIDAVNGTELYVTASDARSPRGRNLTAWDDGASTKTWPVLVVWGWNRRATNDDDDADAGAAATAAMMATKKPLAQLSCIKATNNNGARPTPTPTPTATPTTVPKSAAMESATSTLTGLALLTVALSFVLFC